MKRRIKCTISLMLVLAAAFLCTACSSSTAYPTPTTISEPALQQELKDFLSINGGNRTCLTREEESRFGFDGEYRAAEYLAQRLTDIVGGTAQEKWQDFTSTIWYNYGENSDIFDSQNIKTTIKAPSGSNPNGYRIVLGSGYDNIYQDSPRNFGSSSYYFNGTGSEGALASGTDVVTLLAAAEHLYANRDKLTVDVDIVFFGMSYYSLAGVANYLEALGERGREGLMLAMTFTRMGTESLYAYFDEVETRHGQFVFETAQQIGYGDVLKKPRIGQAAYNVAATENLPYLPIGLVGNAAGFFDSYNICAFYSGSHASFVLSDSEGSHPNLAFTTNDTRQSLESFYSDCYKQIGIAAELAVAIATSQDIAPVCLESYQTTFNYFFMTNPIIAIVATLVFAFVALIIMTLTINSLKARLAKEQYYDNEYHQSDLAPPFPSKSINPFDEFDDK